MLSVCHELESDSGWYATIQISQKCCGRNSVIWGRNSVISSRCLMLRETLLWSYLSVFVWDVYWCKLTLALSLTATLFNKLVTEDRSEKNTNALNLFLLLLFILPLFSLLLFSIVFVHRNRSVGVSTRAAELWKHSLHLNVLAFNKWPERAAQRCDWNKKHHFALCRSLSLFQLCIES